MTDALLRPPRWVFLEGGQSDGQAVDCLLERQELFWPPDFNSMRRVCRVPPGVEASVGDSVHAREAATQRKRVRNSNLRPRQLAFWRILETAGPPVVHEASEKGP